MKIKFKKNTDKTSSDFSVINGKEYTVYAMVIREGSVWYFICDESYTYYPFWNPSNYFELTEGKISRFWVFYYNDQRRTYPIWTFSKWANNPGFYDNLTDGSKSEIETFKKYKELMDLEFPDYSVEDKAEIADDKWLICPFCIDAWESANQLDGMVRCPKCERLLRNPRYKDDFPIISTLPNE